MKNLASCTGICYTKLLCGVEKRFVYCVFCPPRLLSPGARRKAGIYF
jgi:hypothetical protein